MPSICSRTESVAFNKARTGQGAYRKCLIKMTIVFLSSHKSPKRKWRPFSETICNDAANWICSGVGGECSSKVRGCLFPPPLELRSSRGNLTKDREVRLKSLDYTGTAWSMLQCSNKLQESWEHSLHLTAHGWSAAMLDELMKYTKSDK